MTQKNEEQGKSEVQKTNLQLSIFDGAGDTGFEGTVPDTYKTPFVKILQALSPELKKSKAILCLSIL